MTKISLKGKSMRYMHETTLSGNLFLSLGVAISSWFLIQSDSVREIVVFTILDIIPLLKIDLKVNMEYIKDSGKLNYTISRFGIKRFSVIDLTDARMILKFLVRDKNDITESLVIESREKQYLVIGRVSYCYGIPGDIVTNLAHLLSIPYTVNANIKH